MQPASMDDETSIKSRSSHEPAILEKADSSPPKETNEEIQDTEPSGNVVDWEGLDDPANPRQ